MVTGLVPSIVATPPLSVLIVGTVADEDWLEAAMILVGCPTLNVPVGITSAVHVPENPVGFTSVSAVAWAVVVHPASVPVASSSVIKLSAAVYVVGAPDPSSMAVLVLAPGVVDRANVAVVGNTVETESPLPDTLDVTVPPDVAAKTGPLMAIRLPTLTTIPARLPISAKLRFLIM